MASWSHYVDLREGILWLNIYAMNVNCLLGRDKTCRRPEDHTPQLLASAGFPGGATAEDRGVFGTSQSPRR